MLLATTLSGVPDARAVPSTPKTRIRYILPMTTPITAPKVFQLIISLAAVPRDQFALRLENFFFLCDRIVERKQEHIYDVLVY